MRNLAENIAKPSAVARGDAPCLRPLARGLLHAAHSCIASRLVLLFPLLLAGAALMQQVFDALSRHPEIKETYLHVWVRNEEALRFYERIGFTKQSKVENYYVRIEEPHAWVLRKVNDAPAPAK